MGKLRTVMVKRVLSSWWVAVLFAVAGSMLLAFVFAHKTYNIDGFRVGANVLPAYRGETELAIPPFGEITASTHRPPVKIRLTFNRIYLDELRRTLAGRRESFRQVELESRQAFRDFTIRLIALGIVGGAIGAALSPRMRGFKAAAGALTGAAIVGLLIASTYLTYNSNAFRQPRYSGALSVAPWAVNEVANAISNFNEFRKQISQVARNINRFYSRVEAWQPIDGSTIQVLHISDIHNNPLAFDMIERVITGFDIDIVIDTGDITDYGTPIENQLGDRIAELSVPYVFVPGNHDSSTTINFLQTVDNAIVLADSTATISGISILGISDPQAGTYEIAPPSQEVEERTQERIGRILQSMTSRPQILAVHSPWIAEEFLGEVPIILVGHTHSAGITEQNGSVMLNAGTTGAAGIRTFEAEEGVPYTLNILNIDHASKQLVAVDTLSVRGNAREFSIERRAIEGLVEETETTGAPATEGR